MTNPPEGAEHDLDPGAHPEDQPPTESSDEPSPTEAPKASRTGLILGTVIAVLALAAGGAVVWLTFGGKTATPAPNSTEQQPFSVAGTLQIRGGCYSSGYSDIRPGTQVVVTDETGKVLAIGDLVRGSDSCSYTFAVNGVPPGHSFYGVTVSHRGTIQYTEANLRAGPHLTLG